MLNKKQLRKKFFYIRKKKYFEIKPNFFKPLQKIIKKRVKKGLFNISLYYPSMYEVNVLKLFDTHLDKRLRFSLPVIKENNIMYFYSWKKNDLLQINQFGLLEPISFLKFKHKIPDLMLVPLLAYDKENYRLGYGGGFYDRYLNKFLKKHKNILTVGIAFSCQKHDKLPSSKEDVKLNYILNEKGIF